LCLLYPKRSITSHRFCGSGRLFRLSDGKREAGSDMRWLLTELVVADDTNNSERRQAYLGFIPLSREYCIKCIKLAAFCKSNQPVRSKEAKRLQNGQILLLSVQPGRRRRRREAGGDQAVTARECRRSECVTKERRRASNESVARFSSACSYKTMQEKRGVLVGAFQSEREEETRD